MVTRSRSLDEVGGGVVGESRRRRLGKRERERESSERAGSKLNDETNG